MYLIWQQLSLRTDLLCATRFQMAHQVSLSSLSLSPPSTSASASSHCSQRRRIFLSTLRFEAASSLSASTPNSKAKVVVTRERGKNGKLIKALVCHSSLSLSLRYCYFLEIFFLCVLVGFLGFQNALFWCFCSFFFNLLVIVSFTLLYLQFI